MSNQGLFKRNSDVQKQHDKAFDYAFAVKREAERILAAKRAASQVRITVLDKTIKLALELAVREWLQTELGQEAVYVAAESKRISDIAKLEDEIANLEGEITKRKARIASLKGEKGL